MAHLPIRRMTLYKHGVGFFERRADVAADQVELSFRVEEMNDILKSLTAVDWGDGQVLGIDYATPQTREERLAGCTVRLSDKRSLQDLVTSLRGRRVTLHLDQDESRVGTLVGLDQAPDRQPMASALVSLLLDEPDDVRAFELGRVQGLEVLDDRGAADLRFFLETSLSQEDYRSVTVRLSPGDHDLSVSYIAPAPTWRVSYRLVAEPDAADTAGAAGRALVQGWGIFDNRLEEDLDGIALSLVAGMPISFIYDLYTPFTPERPVIEEEGRVAAGPVMFEAPVAGAEPEAAPQAKMVRSMAMAAPASARRRTPRMDIDAMEHAAAVDTKGTDLGELFQYNINTPVTVGRGHSAMVPILQSTLPYRKHLIYNGRKMPTHPVATIRLDNETGLTLEKGPVTVLESGEYVGEALLPFTVIGSEIVVPYAVELGVKIQEKSGTQREVRGISFKDAYLQFEEWDIRWREYQIDNATADTAAVLVEHARTSRYELFETEEPTERTSDQLRFAVSAGPRGETVLRVRERRLRRRQEEIRKQSFAGLRAYLDDGLLTPRQLSKLSKLLEMWESVAEQEKHIADLGAERAKVYRAQEQIQGNMGALGRAGKEGALRARYVQQLEATEGRLRTLDRQDVEAKAEIERLQGEIASLLKQLS